MAALIENKTFILIFIECFDFVNIFFPKVTSEFFKYTKICDYNIKLIDKQ